MFLFKKLLVRHPSHNGSDFLVTTIEAFTLVKVEPEGVTQEEEGCNNQIGS
jgi:hypothetical protein